jgi:hypothetical protein
MGSYSAAGSYQAEAGEDIGHVDGVLADAHRALIRDSLEVQRGAGRIPLVDPVVWRECEVVCHDEGRPVRLLQRPVRRVGTHAVQLDVVT